MNLLFLPQDFLDLKARRDYISGKHREAGAACGEASEQGESFAGHDNAPFEAAMLDMNIRSRMLREVDNMLNRAVSFSPEPNDGSVKFGRMVLVNDVTHAESTWYLVGSPWTQRTGEGHSQSDPLPTSYMSPIGRVLLGHKIGDEVHFQKRTLKILEIH